MPSSVIETMQHLTKFDVGKLISVDAVQGRGLNITGVRGGLRIVSKGG